MKNKFYEYLNRLKPRGIQSTLMISFSMISVFIMLILGVVLYIRFSNISRGEIVETTRKLMEQTGENLEDYLVSMRQISDAVYYNVVKESDFLDEESSIQKGMNLLYEANRDTYNRDVTYVPSVKAVMDRLVPAYVRGDLYGALVESYCSEQNARMTAMKSSSDNARAMLQTLNLSFNRARQAAITQEITEVVGGAQAAL